MELNTVGFFNEKKTICKRLKFAGENVGTNHKEEPVDCIDIDDDNPGP